MKNQLSIYLGILALVFVTLGCDKSSPTSPSPTPSANIQAPTVPLEARLVIKRVEATVFVESYYPPKLGIRYDLRIQETNGLGTSLNRAHLKVTDSNGGPYASVSKPGPIRIPGGGTKNVNVTWIFNVKVNKSVGDFITTYTFVDDNGNKKQLTLTNAETRVVGLREALQQFQK